MKYLVVALTAMLAFAGIAYAQDTVVGVDASLIDFLLQIILLVVSAIITIFLPIVLKRMADKYGLQIEAEKRDALQVTFTNAAAGLLMRLGDRAKSLKVDVRSPELADAIRRVQAGAPDALKWAGLNEQEIARRIIEKVPQVAPETVTPVSDPIPPRDGILS